jgi:hypothetical protein
MNETLQTCLFGQQREEENERERKRKKTKKLCHDYANTLTYVIQINFVNHQY